MVDHFKIIRDNNIRAPFPKSLITAEMAGEILASELAEDIYYGQLEKKWEGEREKNTRDGFIQDGTPTEEEAFELRRKYLIDEFESLCRRIANADEQEKRNLIAQKNRVQFTYEIITYKPEYQITDDSIMRARKREIGEFIELNKQGFAVCPFHKEKTASFRATKNLFYCFGCGEKGDTIVFIKKTKGLSFADTIAFLNVDK